MPDEPRWLSAHLALGVPAQAPAADHLITSVVAPFVERALNAGWIDRFFYVRYADRGPHLRLRLHGLPENLDGVVRPALLELATTDWPTPEAITSGQQPSSEEVLRWVPYEPEFDRYGGGQATRLAEECFWISSRIAVDVMRGTASERSTRLGQGLLCMLVFAHVFGCGRTDVATYSARYASSNLRGFARAEGSDVIWTRAFDDGFTKQAESIEPFIEETWERLKSDASLSPTLDELRDGLIDVRDRLQLLCKSDQVKHYGRVVSAEGAFLTIVPSYIHMMNNRLGLTIRDEAYVAHLISRSLSSRVIAEVAPQ